MTPELKIDLRSGGDFLKLGGRFAGAMLEGHVYIQWPVATRAMQKSC